MTKGSKLKKLYSERSGFVKNQGRLLIYGCLFLLFVLHATQVLAEGRRELNKGWQFAFVKDEFRAGQEISTPGSSLTGWRPAVVPGTVLTSMLHNRMVPDPFRGMNNKLIPDIYEAGTQHYTCWFVCETEARKKSDEQVYLEFRGVNYRFELYVNGVHVNGEPAEGMFLRHKYEITKCLRSDGKLRIAVRVEPPDPPGNPNGGQGGDGVIARNLTNQYTAGWDWIQPIHDRNTGIWDKVIIERVSGADIRDVQVVAHVPGKRMPGGRQKPVKVRVSADVANTSGNAESGWLELTIAGKEYRRAVSLLPGESKRVALPDAVVENPLLWWPNGMGEQALYDLVVSFVKDDDGVIADEENVTVGLRELSTRWNSHTQSREMYVNGQRLFVKGGNWILSDAMLRFSKARYDAEVRYHRDMHLNMIRVWGGGITERPEFYDACDRYGILVFQDLWMTGDCNGRWHDTYKKDDTNGRRAYPDDHILWLAAAEDQVKMLRNHASLATWCGGNEIRPPADMLEVLKDEIFPSLDGSRYFFEYSNHDSMSLAAHDGPYTIQADTFFWQHRSYGFNSEVGSVGIGDRTSLERFLPAKNMVPPRYDVKTGRWTIDSVWRYHKYSSYDSSVERYGTVKGIDDFLRKAQLVNYNQYRALMEGYRSHMWDWYTGVLEWKTQNPWTAMVGQMYDVYLDPNACMYGLAEGAKPLHVMFHPVKRCIMVANDDPVNSRVVDLSYAYNYTRRGQNNTLDVTYDAPFTIPPDTCIAIEATGDELDSLLRGGGLYTLKIAERESGYSDEQTYWMQDERGSYKWLNKMPEAELAVSAQWTTDSTISVSLENGDDAPPAFFLHLTVVDGRSGKRVLPLFCPDNYFTIGTGQRRAVKLAVRPVEGVSYKMCVEGWNVPRMIRTIKK